MPATDSPEQILDSAIDTLSTRPDARSWLDELAEPIYTTDAEGAVTYWNRACVDFAGREPQLGTDRWCVTWKIYTTTGERLPHDRCPMAQAIRQQRPIREAVAIAERPDGSRIAFKPFPTPLFDEQGRLTGAINLLVDVTEEQCAVLHEQADRCRRLAGAMYDRATSKVLGDMACNFDRTADEISRQRGA